MLGNCSKTYLIFLMCLVGNFHSRYVLIKISKPGIAVEEIVKTFKETLNEESLPTSRMGRCRYTYPILFAGLIHKIVEYEYLRTWMRFMPDCWRISTMTLPGAHDAATWEKLSECSNIFTSFCCVCQDKIIQEQLQWGIRVLDIRPALFGGEIILWHGDLKLRVDLYHVLSTVQRFLNFNPTETVIVSFKCWWSNHWCGYSFAKEFCKVLDRIGRSWIYPSMSKDVTPATTPTLGEVRGKIVLHNRDGRKEQDAIPSLNVENDEEDTYQFDYSYERYYNELSTHIMKAKDEIFEGKEKEGVSWDPKKFYITWLSANNCGINGHTISGIASSVNPWIANKLRCLMLKHPNPNTRYRRWQPSGIIMMDYPTHEIIGQLIMDNVFHYLPFFSRYRCEVPDAFDDMTCTCSNKSAKNSRVAAYSLIKSGKSCKHIIRSFEECKYAAKEMNATFIGTLNGGEHSSLLPKECSYSENSKGEVHLSWNDLNIGKKNYGNNRQQVCKLET